MTIAGLILAGGASTRMGHDKAFVTLGGRTLLQHMTGRLGDQVGPLAVNTNADLARFVDADLPILQDGDVDGGPLAGVLVGLRWARQLPERPGFLATVPIDTPFIPADLVARLDAGREDRPMIAIGASGDRDHPIVALWPISLLDRLEEWRKTAKGRGIRGFLAAYGFTVVNFGTPEPGTDPFFNVNTPDDLVEAERRLDAERRTARF